MKFIVLLVAIVAITCAEDVFDLDTVQLPSLDKILEFVKPVIDVIKPYIQPLISKLFGTSQKTEDAKLQIAPIIPILIGLAPTIIDIVGTIFKKK